MSRPFGSGLAVSKSISESAASMGSDFLYPTAFMPDLPGADATGHLPRAPAAAGQRERICRHDAAIRCIRRIVLVGFAGQDIANLRIAAVELDARRRDKRVAIDIVPEIFALSDEGTVCSR